MIQASQPLTEILPVTPEKAKDNGHRSWIDELPGIIRKCMQIASKETVGMDGDDVQEFSGDNFDVQVQQEEGVFKLYIIPGIVPIEPLEHDVDTDNLLLSLTVRPYAWWIDELAEE